MQTRKAFFLSMLLGSVLAMAPTYGQTRTTDSGEVRDQINKTVPLAPGSNVRVSIVSGEINIETWDSDRAEINITIKASDTAAMEREPIIVEDTPNSLTIRVENDNEGRRRGRDRGWVSHDVRLKLPKSVNLKVASVNGGIDVGAITGEVTASSVNGGIAIAQAGTATHLNSVNGSISISLLRLSEAGLRVSTVNGSVKIGLPSETNAEISFTSVNGGVNSDLPITVIGEVKRGQLRGRVGDGGPTINITSVNGGVTLRRN
jgi:Putative adhesin